MPHINIQHHRPDSVALEVNTKNPDLVTLEVREGGTYTSVTLDRETWMEIGAALHDVGLSGVDLGGAA
jgi:hypothetical protein